MTVCIDIDENAVLNSEFKLENGVDYKQAIKDAVEHAHTEVMCPFDIEVNVMITDNNGIHQINNETRGIDRPTDVLSFPCLEFNIPGDFGDIKKEDVERCVPYVRVIGFNDRGREVLKIARESAILPIVMKFADIKELDDNAKAIFNIESRATDIFALTSEKNIPCGMEKTQNIIKISENF